MKVEFLATGDSEDCGIAMYTTSLQETLDIESARSPVKLRSLDLPHYVCQAMKAATTDADVVHVQHEYGIYGPKSVTSWFVFPILWLIATIRGRPIVVTFHSAWNDETIDPPLYELKRLYVGLNDRLLAAVADYAIFLSEDTREAFERTVSLETVEVLPHGVQTDVRPMPQAEAKRQFDCDPDELLVTEPGYVRPEKGYDRFLDIADRVDDARFLVGGGPQGDNHPEYFEGLRDRCSDAGVRVTGVLDEDDFHALFNAMDLALLPYDAVSQSGIVNWCLAYEVPIVTTDLERFRTLESEFGFPRTFPADDADAGASAVQQVLNDSHRVLKAMRDYREENAMDAIAERHEEVYRAVA